MIRCWWWLLESLSLKLWRLPTLWPRLVSTSESWTPSPSSPSTSRLFRTTLLPAMEESSLWRITTPRWELKSVEIFLIRVSNVVFTDCREVLEMQFWMLWLDIVTWSSARWQWLLSPGQVLLMLCWRCLVSPPATSSRLSMKSSNCKVPQQPTSVNNQLVLISNAAYNWSGSISVFIF